MMKKIKVITLGIVISIIITTPIFATQPVAQAKSQQTAKETTFTTTNLKNPTIINGIAYGDEAFIKKSFGIKFVNGGDMIREDTAIQLGVDKGSFHIPRVNWTFSGDSSVIAKTINGKLMYPLKFIASQMNSEVSYNPKTEILTVNNYGLKEIPRVQDEFVTVRGKVLGFDGEPTVGLQVHLFEPGKISYSPAIDSIEGERCVNPVTQQGHGVPIAYTDENGYYEFRNVDTKVLPFVSISVQNVKYKGVDVSGNSIGKEMNAASLQTIKHDDELKLHDSKLYGLRGVYSNRVEMPTMHLYRE